MVDVDARKMEIEHLKRKNYEFAEAAWEERKVKKWQGISLKLNWLIEEMERVGAIRLQTMNGQQTCVNLSSIQSLIGVMVGNLCFGKFLKMSD